MPLPPCRAHRSRKAGEWLRTCPGRDPFIRKAAQQAFGLTNGSLTHGKAGEASLCAHASSLRDAGTHLIFSGKIRPQLNPAG